MAIPATPHPKKTVAVIGAGVCGVMAAAYLKDWGLDVTVFERSRQIGGVWVLDEELPMEPGYPNIDPLTGEENYFADNEDMVDGDGLKNAVSQTRVASGSVETGYDINETLSSLSLEQGFKSYKTRAEARIRHAPPGPCYHSLKNNIPTQLMELQLLPWPEGTETNIPHENIKDYIQAIAAKYEIEPLVRLGTRVVNAEYGVNKGKWVLKTEELVEADEEDEYRVEKTELEFDNLLVAIGHFSIPNVPPIPNLETWKRAFPDRIQHSKRYRRPDEYKDQTVLLIGSSVSSTDIAISIGTVAKKVYQSGRGGQFDLPATLLPENAVRVAGIESFGPLTQTANMRNGDGKGAAIPGTITLTDGTTLTGIDRIIVCTGYLVSYPFLPQYQSSTTEQKENPSTYEIPPIITPFSPDTVGKDQGQPTTSLHYDIFYIPTPSLAFIGIPYHVPTFPLYEYQTIAVAAAWSGVVDLPSEAEMWRTYAERVEKKGNGRALNSLRGEDEAYVGILVDWVNSGLLSTKSERPLVKGYSEKWLAGMREFKERIKKRTGWDFHKKEEW